MARINEKDLELLSTGLTVDLTQPNFNYLGGEFLTNENDYIEALIHDSNAIFLESVIVNVEDYNLKDDGSINLKQGNILRRAGYDRGKFIVKYNFLRRYAGSYENVLVDKSGQILNRPFDPAIDNEDMIKQDRYFIQEISPSRKEVRILPQSISNKKYIDDFYYLQREFRKAELNTLIRFDSQGGDFLDTDTFEAVDPPSEEFNSIKQFMRGGQISSDRAFITSYTPPPPVYTGAAPTRTDEIDADVIQPSFFITNLEADLVEGLSLEGLFDVVDNTTVIDFELKEHFNVFKGYNTLGGGVPPEIGGTDAIEGLINATEIGAQIHPSLQVPKIDNIVGLDVNRYGFPRVKTYGSKGNPTRTGLIVLTSNSALPANVPTTYTWEVTGWDYDTGGGGTTEGFNRFKAFDTNQLGEEDQWVGEVGIETPSSDVTNYATVTDPAAAPLRATFTYDGLETSIPGCSIAIRVYGGHIRVGLMLTITQDTGVTKTIHYPCIIETDWDDG